MLIAGMLGERGLAFFSERTGKKGHVKSFNARFRAMVFPGDKISIGGIVKSAGDQEWTVDLQAKNQKDEVTTTALITIRVGQ
jgi:acyl-CoA thioesterase FadM